MHHIRNLFILLFTSVLLCASVVSQAKENITIIYAYNIADSVANYHRALTIEANAIQDKYLFIFDARPGAGGTIASNYVLNTSNTILAHSTAFFIRPMYTLKKAMTCLCSRSNLIIVRHRWRSQAPNTKAGKTFPLINPLPLASADWELQHT